MSEKYKIIIVDDHALFRSGVKMLLETQEDFQIVEDFSNATEALDYIKKNEKIDLILMDINLPHIDGIEATGTIKKIYPSVKVILLTMYKNEPYLIKAMKNGASGYILKEAATTELINAIRTTLKGDMAIYPSMIEALVQKAIKDDSTEQEEKNSEKSILTPREKEVIHYISLGFTNQEIADMLHISVKTSEKHKSNIMEKLNINRRHDMVKYAIKNNLVDFNSIKYINKQASKS